MDLLNISSNATVRKLLGKEELKFSGKLVKINSKGKKQNRVLIVSDQAMYNLNEKYKCKRRIELDHLAGITESKTSDEFVVHVPSEYDYHFSSANSAQIRDVLVEVFQAMCATKNEHKSFPVVVTEEGDLTINVVTQEIAKNLNESKKQHEKFIDYGPGDYLKLADHPRVLELLRGEKLALSIKATKITHKLKNQDRILIVSDKAIYTLGSSLENRRKVPLEQITALTMSKKSEQFVIHVPMEYDCHFSTSKNAEVAKALQEMAQKDDGTELVLTLAEESDLSERVLTKELARLQTTAEKNDRREALSSPRSNIKGVFSFSSLSISPKASPHAAKPVVNDTNFEVADDGDG